VETAWSPTPKVLVSISNILSPGCKPAREAAYSGWVAKTKIPGSGSNGIPTVVSFIIKIE